MHNNNIIIMILLQLLITFLLSQVRCKTFIISQSASNCPSDTQCLSLSQFATNSSLFKSSQIILLFLPSEHSLEGKLSVEDVNVLKLSSYFMDGDLEKPKIVCDMSAEIQFNAIAKVIISGIDFSGCVNTKVKSVGEFSIVSNVLSGITTSKPNKYYFGIGTSLTVINSTLHILDCIFKNFRSYPTVSGQYFSISDYPGTIECTMSNVSICNSVLINNDGRYIFSTLSELFLQNTTFFGNRPTTYCKNNGSALFMDKSHLTSFGCRFYNNGNVNLTRAGGVFYALNSVVEVYDSHVEGNQAYFGGVFYVEHSKIIIDKSYFNENKCSISGGVLHLLYSSVLSVSFSTFNNNTAFSFGAVLLAKSTKVYVESSLFRQNKAQIGGGLCIWSNSQFYINGDNTFTKNSAHHGSAIHMYFSSMTGNGTLLVQNGDAILETIAFINSYGSFSGNLYILGNKGSLFVFDSALFIAGFTLISNNTLVINHSHSTDILSEGGGITSFLSTLTLSGNVKIENNCAVNGGGLLASASNLLLTGNFSFYKNGASDSGGAMYLHQSKLDVKGQVNFTKNTANRKGGAIHAIGSSMSLTPFKVETEDLFLTSNAYIISNSAERGGGVCFEISSKIYIMSDTNYSVYFIDNIADYGGALFVNDSTNTGTCTDAHHLTAVEVSESNCFFQQVIVESRVTVMHEIFSFKNNVARQLGQYLYGGLLDRCTVPIKNSFGMALIRYAQLPGSFDYIRDFITSDAVRVCFCNESGLADCSYQQPHVKVLRGHSFSVSLTAVDQVNNSINATVCAYLNNPNYRLGEDQRQQRTGTACSILTYNVYSFEENYQETLILYATGPCRNIGISMSHLKIDFLPCHCPIGFVINTNKDKCYCSCDTNLEPYITECNYSTKSLIRSGHFWIDTFILHTNQTLFIIYPYCPLDYCFPAATRVHLNFNIPNASNAQCAFNRVGKLCGACESGLSLSLGSSRCIVCPSYWPGLTIIIIIAFFIGGIVLTTLMLTCNITVATGSINALIFYANIIHANKSIFMPFQTPNLHTIFIHWTNLNFGLDACFINGLNSYIKSWLSLAFPLYLLLVMLMIIFLSKVSARFAEIIGRKNPVATLATLLLLCYTNLLQVVITVVSFAILNYHDHAEVVWAQDATIMYLCGKHIPLFIVAILILVFGTAYTLLLVLWQWLILLSDKSGFKWLKNTKLILFMETYHAPYHSKSRYWTGLLLLVRVILYTSSALTSSREPKINLLLTIVLVGFLLTLASTQIYKNFWLNVLEVAVCYNIVVLSVTMFYLSDTEDEKKAESVAYTSVSISFMLFLAIMVYHLKMVICSCRKSFNSYFKNLSTSLHAHNRQSVTHTEVRIGTSSNLC